MTFLIKKLIKKVAILISYYRELLISYKPMTISTMTCFPTAEPSAKLILFSIVLGPSAKLGFFLCAHRVLWEGPGAFDIF